MIKTLVKLIFLSLCCSSPAWAYPEFVRYGYFSCTSCHVSPSGGGTLTDYGRSFAAEKLATWVKPNEERPLHGLIKNQPEWLLLGGNYRQVQTVVDSSRGESGHWIAMQRDTDLCVATKSPVATFTCATYGLLPKEAEGDKARYGLRKGFVRADVGESFAFRFGRFFPRFGLMIANHTSQIRSGLGFVPFGETDQFEATYMSELLEITAYYDFGRIINLGTDEDDIGKRDKAFGGTVATLIGDKSRLGISYRRENHELNVDHLAGAFAAIGLSESTFVLAEVDQKASLYHTAIEGQGKIIRGAVSHLKLGHEVYRGVIAAVSHESNFKDLRDGFSRSDTYGLGLQWYPRPHFEIDSFYGHVLSRRDFSYASAGYLVIHYYL